MRRPFLYPGGRFVASRDGCKRAARCVARFLLWQLRWQPRWRPVRATACRASSLRRCRSRARCSTTTTWRPPASPCPPRASRAGALSPAWTGLPAPLVATTRLVRPPALRTGTTSLVTRTFWPAASASPLMPFHDFNSCTVTPYRTAIDRQPVAPLRGVVERAARRDRREHRLGQRRHRLGRRALRRDEQRMPGRHPRLGADAVHGAQRLDRHSVLGRHLRQRFVGPHPVRLPRHHRLVGEFELGGEYLGVVDRQQQRLSDPRRRSPAGCAAG